MHIFFVVLLVIILVPIILGIWFMLGITIQGKMSGGKTRKEAWKDLIKEIVYAMIGKRYYAKYRARNPDGSFIDEEK